MFLFTTVTLKLHVEDIYDEFLDNILLFVFIDKSKHPYHFEVVIFLKKVTSLIRRAMFLSGHKKLEGRLDLSSITTLTSLALILPSRRHLHWEFMRSWELIIFPPSSFFKLSIIDHNFNYNNLRLGKLQ